MSPFDFLDRDEDAQGMVEYGLILALVAVVVAVALASFGEGMMSLYDRIAEQVATVIG